ncbi:MAG: hypothetical protein ACYCYM_07875 [Saccharofermentanales bacterium]
MDTKKQGFGIFHTDPFRNEDYFYKTLAFDYMNTYIFDTWTEEPKYKKAFLALSMTEKTAWVSVSTLLFDVRSASSMIDVVEGSNDGESFCPTTTLKPDWKENLQKLVRDLKEWGCWDCFNGMNMDEPLLWNVSLAQLKETTGYFRSICPDKGVFICFSIAGVAPDVWTVNNIAPITADAGQFITDVAFDMYHKFDETYAYITAQMKERMGSRDDLRVWFIPCTMDYRGDKDEQHCLDHLNGCYDLLKKEKNPGGLFCFTFYTFPKEWEDLGNVGLDKLTDPDNLKYWPTLQSEIERIGREICGR